MITLFDRGASDANLDIIVDSGLEPRRGRQYQASEALEDAINVAIVLGRPLLVSGEPGCGKTELGFSIARKMGIRRVHFFSAKSDSEARKLFYDFHS